MKRIYICSPLRGDYKRNIAKAQEYCRGAAYMGVLPIAPHIYFTQFLNDADPYERKQGMALGIELLELCDELWVFGEPSEGMRAEITHALAKGITVRSASDARREYGAKGDAG